MFSCPVKSSPEWQQLVEQYGETQAYVEWAKQNGVIIQQQSIESAMSYFEEVTGEQVSVDEVVNFSSLIKQGYFGEVADAAPDVNAAILGNTYTLAFNKIWQASLTNGEKQMLMDEVATTLNRADLTHADVNEILAEDFSTWKITGESQFFSGPPERKSFAERMYQKILSFIRKVMLIRDYGVESTFNKIDLGVYANKGYKDITDSNITYGGMDSRTTKEFLDMLNYWFFEEIFDALPANMRFVEKDFSKLNVDLNAIYSKLRADLGGTEGVTYYFSTNEGFEEAKILHTNYLKQLGIKFDLLEDDDTGENTIETPESKASEYAEGDTISTMSIATPLIKLMLSTVPDFRVAESELYNKTGGFKMYPLPVIWKMVQEVTLDKFNQTQMLEALRVAAETDQALSFVYDRISLAPEGVKNQFFKAFSNTKANGKLGILKSDGSIKFIDANESQVVNMIIDSWQQAMRDNDKVYSIEKGVNPARIAAPTKGNSESQREFLRALGIEYSGPMDFSVQISKKKRMSVSEIANSIHADLMEVAKKGTRIDNYTDIGTATTGSKGAGTYSKVKALAKIESQIAKGSIIENMGVGPDGTTRYEIVRANPIDIIKADIIGSESFEDLIAKQPHLAKGYKLENGVYTFYSKAVEEIYNLYEADKKPQLSIVTVYGSRPDQKGARGSAYKKMQPDERKLLDIAAMLNEERYVPLRRAGDKGTQRYVEGLPEITNVSKFYETMWGYFQYEYAGVLEGKPWGLFDGILDADQKNALGGAGSTPVDIDSMRAGILFRVSRHMDKYTYQLAQDLYDSGIISGSYKVTTPQGNTIANTAVRKEKLEPLTETQKKAYTGASVSLQNYMTNPALWWEAITEVSSTATALESALGFTDFGQAYSAIKGSLLVQLRDTLSVAPKDSAVELQELISAIDSDTEQGKSFVAYYLSNASKSGEFAIKPALEQYAEQIVAYKYAENKVNNIYDLTLRFNNSDNDLKGDTKTPEMIETDAELIQIDLENGTYTTYVREGRMTAQNVFDLAGGSVSPSILTQLELAEAAVFQTGKKIVSVGDNTVAGIIPDTHRGMPVVDYIAMNHMVAAFEQQFLFYGDLSNYKLKDFFKRMSMPVGNGTIAITDSDSMNLALVEDYDNMNKVTANYKEYRKANPDKFSFVTIKDVRETSAQATGTGTEYSDYEKLMLKFYENTGLDLETSLKNIKDIMAAYRNEKGGVNIADAASVMLLPYYREFRIRHQDWSNVQEMTFQAIDNDQEMPKGFGYLNTIKPKGFGFDSDSDPTGIKTSVMPIYPGITKHIEALKGSGIEELIQLMMENSTDMLALESAVKVGNPAKVELLTKKGFTTDYTPKVMPVKWFQIQVEMPSEVKDEAIEGSQQRIQIFSDLFDNGSADENISALATEYNALFTTLINDEKARFIRETGFSQVGDKYYVTNPYRLVEIIKEAAISGNLPTNVLNSLKVNEETGEFEFLLDSIPASTRIMNVIFARANSNLIRLKSNVSGYVQVPNLFFRNKLKDNKLQYIIQDGKVIGAEVYVSYGFLKRAGYKLTPEQIADPTLIDPRMLELLGYRIPTEGPASISKLIIKGFLPEEMGDTVVVPEDIPGVAGSDFDIDKMYIIRPNVDRSGYIEPFRDVEQAWLAYKKAAFIEISKLRRAAGTDPQAAQVFKRLQEIRTGNAITAEAMSADGTSLINYDIGEELENLLKKSTKEGGVDVRFLVSFFRKYGKIILTKEEYVAEFADKLIETNSKQQIQNRILEIELEIMTTEKYSGRNFIANSNSILLAQAKEYTKERKLGTKTDLFRLDIEWITGQSFLAGKDLVGITAQHLKFRTLAQMAGLKFSDTITDEDGKTRKIELYYSGAKSAAMTAGDRYNLAGELISQLFAQHLTAFVDASADPFIFRLNTNEITIQAKYFMMHAGAPIDYVHAMLLQPVILEYVEGMRKVNSGVNELKKGKNRLTKEKVIQSLLVKYSGIQLKNGQKFINPNSISFRKAFTLEQLKQEMESPSTEQAALLLQFLEYDYNGKAVSNAINSATQDTKGSGKNLLNSLEYKAKKTQQLQGGIFTNFSDLFTKTPLQSFDLGAEEFALGAFLQLSVLREQNVRDLVQAIMDDYLSRLGYVDSRIISKFMNTYISTRVLSGAGFGIGNYLKLFRAKADNRFKSKFNANETVGGVVNSIKKSNLPASEYFFPVNIQDIVDEGDGKKYFTLFSGLKIDNRRMLSSAADLITESLVELHGVGEAAFKKIVNATIAMYGSVNHPNSPASLLPTSLLAGTMSDYYSKGNISNEQALDVFFANNHDNNIAVPFKSNQPQTDKTSTGIVYEYISMPSFNSSYYIKVNKKVNQMINGENVEVDKVILMKRIKNDPVNNIAFYLPVNKKGKELMREFHTDFYSIFPSNNYVTKEVYDAAYAHLTGNEYITEAPVVTAEPNTVTNSVREMLTKMIDPNAPAAEQMELIEMINRAKTIEDVAILKERLCAPKK